MLAKIDRKKQNPFQINPERTIPTLVDGDFTVWDSHAICAYLVDKYGNDDKLYPKDLQLRAKCNQRLFFDAGSCFVRLRDITLQIFFRGGCDVPEYRIEPIYAAYEILERFLAVDPFLVGNQLTIADVSVSISILSLGCFAPLQIDKHSKILAWIELIKKTIPFFDEMNAQPLNDLKVLSQSALEANKQKQ